MTRRARVGTAVLIFLVIGIPGAFMYLVTTFLFYFRNFGPGIPYRILDIVNYGAEHNGFYHWDGWEWSGHARAEGYSMNHKPRKGDIAVWDKNEAGAGSKGSSPSVATASTNPACDQARG